MRGESQGRCSDRATRRGGRQQGLDRQGGNHSIGDDKWSKYVASRLRVELDTIMKNRVHGPIEGHEKNPNKLVVVEKDAHVHGT